MFGNIQNRGTNPAESLRNLPPPTSTNIEGLISCLIEGSLEAKLPTIWTDEKQSREEAERRERLQERRVEEKE